MFDYDESGNQIKRDLICVNCDDPLRPAPEQIGEEDKESIGLTQSDKYEQLSYYPNPVLEQLYIKWVNSKELYVVAVEVYTLKGQKVVSFQDLAGVNNYKVNFENLAQGVYVVMLIYNNESIKDLKVIKK
ncbi:MAG: hypothetical protein BM557_07745 [Flavobacterium sp. MedPE-SWcel]|nr:MAG: hypothetical protein BM557_07745 [Flavobacterium sp. MedPE-SWcel]